VILAAHNTCGFALLAGYLPSRSLPNYTIIPLFSPHPPAYCIATYPTASGGSRLGTAEAAGNAERAEWQANPLARPPRWRRRSTCFHRSTVLWY